jgi:U4/U6 small nuclear ribonucleoprotein PRP4
MADTLPESTRREMELHASKVQDFELRRKMKGVVVPTDDGKVRVMLRQLELPITMFGEKEGDRRDRLRKYVAEMDAEQADAPATGQIVLQQQEVRNELFYTEGSEELKDARARVAQFSLRRAAQRIRAAKRRHDDEESRAEAATDLSCVLDEASRLSQQCSEVGDDRPISGCRFSPDGSSLAVCGWGGVVSLFTAAGCTKTVAAPAHTERCTDVVWHPRSGLGQSGDAVNLATGCADGTAALLSGSGGSVRLGWRVVGAAHGGFVSASSWPSPPLPSPTHPTRPPKLPG